MSAHEKLNLSLALCIGDFAPDGAAHLSPELRRAQLAGVYHPTPSPPCSFDHCHNGLDLSLVIHGSAQLTIGQDQHFTLIPGQIFIIPGGNRHRLSVEADGHLCCYGVEIYSPIFHSLSLSPDLQALAHRLTQQHDPVPFRLIGDPTAFQSLRSLFEEMIVATGESDDECSVKIVNTYGELLALYVLKLMQQENFKLPDHPSVQRVLEVQAWLDRHFPEPITLAEMAQMANLSQPHFGYLFHKVIGVSPKSYLLTRRLEHAGFLLANTNLPVILVAQTVGFNNPTNFTGAFTKYAGQKPSEYRKTHQPLPTLPALPQE